MMQKQQAEWQGDLDYFAMSVKQRKKSDSPMGIIPNGPSNALTTYLHGGWWQIMPFATFTCSYKASREAIKKNND